MTIEIAPHRDTIPIFYAFEGKQFVRIIKENNFKQTISLPEGAKILELGDLIGS